MFQSLAVASQSEAEKLRIKSLEHLEELQAMSLDRARVAEAQQQLLQSKAELQRKKIARDAEQQAEFAQMAAQMELSARKAVEKATEKVRHEEQQRRHVFETLYMDVAEECRIYNEHIMQDQSESMLPKHFTHALEPEPGRDSDDEEIEAPVNKKRNAVPQKSIFSSLLPI